MPLDSSKSSTSQGARNLEDLLAIRFGEGRDQNFKYLPPPRLYTTEDLGVPYPYLSTFAGPVTVRTITDRSYLILLVAFAAVWVFILFYAFLNSFLTLRLNITSDDDDKTIPHHPTDFFTITLILFSIMLLVVFLSMFYLFLFLYIPRAMVYISCVLCMVTVIAVSLFMEAFIIAETSFDHNVFKVFGFLNVSFFVRAVVLILIIYVKIIYANSFKIAIDLIILVLQFIKEIRAVIMIPLIPSIIAVVFTSLNIGIIYLLVYTQENLVIQDLESDCKCNNGYENGSSCMIPEFQRNCYTGSRDECSHLACSPSPELTSIIVFSLIFIVFFLLWCYEILFTVLMLVMDNIYAKYYFHQVSSQNSTQVLKESFYSILRYHLGTAAYGALVMMFLQLPSFLVNRIDRMIQLRPYCLLKPIDNYVHSIRSDSKSAFLDFMNHFRATVYVFTVLFGFKFQDSFHHNFKLVYRNAQRFYVPDMLIDTIFKAAKWTLFCIICIVSSYFVCGGERVCLGHTNHAMHTLEYATVILLICATTYAVISYCFSIISSAVYTIYICFLTESEMLSFKLLQEPARWETNHSRRKLLLQCLHRPPPPSPSPSS